MQKEFVTYEQALALKELDYDEPCLAKFIVPGDLVLPGHYENTDVVCATITQNDICEAHVLAPIKQQVFRWFRKNYKIRFYIQSAMADSGEYFKLLFPDGEQRGTAYDTNEDAENACIDKLIELFKQDKK